MSQYDSQVDYLEMVSTGSLERGTTVHVNSLVDNLARMRAQIGIALSGTASVWGPGSPNPLTAGPSSNADAYHTHGIITQTFVSGSNITASRALYDGTTGTQYHNIHATPMFVAVTVPNGTGTGTNHSALTLQICKDNFAVNDILTVGNGSADSSTANLYLTANGVVPAAWYYRCIAFGSPTPTLVHIPGLDTNGWVEIV